MKPALNLRQRALIGNRESKVKGSPEWIAQTCYLASVRLSGLEHSVESWREVVGDLEEVKAWEVFPPEKPYGSREAFFHGEFGKPEPELTRAKEEQQKLRAKAGRPKKGEENPVNNRIKYGSIEHIRARLERDADHHPDPAKREHAAQLLPRVQAGELSAHAAAVEAGWRTRMVQIAPTVEGFDRAIRNHLTPVQQNELFDRFKGGSK